MIKSLSIILLAVLCASALHAQAPDANNRFRLAQSYEQGGDFENAIKVYKNLLAADPSNYVVFEGLRRSYLQLKKYEDALALIQTRLSANPADINLLCIKGSALYQSGKEKNAYDAWEQAIAVDAGNPNVYRLVANALLENRLLDKTAELYRRARKATGDPNLFTLDLAQLLSVTMDYAGATTEFLRYLAQTPTQLGYVQSRMSQYTGKEEARAAAIEVVRSAQKHSDDISLHRLLGWLMLEGKHFNDAFDVYRRIDKLTNAHGSELYTFAERAYKEGSYAIAAQAYQEAVRVPLPSDRLPYAKFGYALAMKELSIQADTVNTAPAGGSVPENRSRYATAIDYFRNIIAEYPNSEFAARSYYQIGTIQFEKYFDLDGALSSFTSVGKFLPPGNPVHLDITLKIGEVLTAKGDTAGAAQRFRIVIAANNATPDQQDEATYRLSELRYLSGNFAEAIKLLDTISKNVKADYANDAILLRAFLQENSLAAEAPLKEFVRADLMARQQRYTEAILLFQFVVDKNPKALFVDDALMKIALLQTRAHLYQDALATYERLLSQFKESSIALDKAQFSVAELYDYRLNDKSKAIASYEKLLAEYPQSLLIDSARKRIRELRGDSL